MTRAKVNYNFNNKINVIYTKYKCNVLKNKKFTRGPHSQT